MKSESLAAGEPSSIVNRQSSIVNRSFEPLIFEQGSPGRRGFQLPPLDVPAGPMTQWIPSEFLRSVPPALPELSELEVVRHFMRLAHLNFSVETNVYPLGSCTMKYNPRVHEEIAALPGFSQVHPYEPDAGVQGLLQLLYELEQLLAEILGMEEVTLQPAAGAHGEFTGLLIARAYHAAQGRPRHRVIVPDSSHGTNPASAALCGYEVVEVKSNRRGRVDLAELSRVVDQDTAVFMLTNPNTLGLFEEEILEIARIVHGAGALMYLDGANLNALLGLYRPGDVGFDMTHVNVHKTFSIPHGSGGPGGAPLGVKAHLAPYLPGPRLEMVPGVGARHQLRKGCLAPMVPGTYRWVPAPPESIGRVRAFAGNVGALVRAYAYIRTLGADGLKDAARQAIVNANYLRARLKEAYRIPVDEPCMHEFVASAVDQKALGVRALDIAKRLLDYGCYAPTIYFPLIIEEALMIEPSETESRQALDQLADALRAIAREAVADPREVQTAPHTMPVSRLDEVLAAREPNLRWQPSREA